MGPTHGHLASARPLSKIGRNPNCYSSFHSFFSFLKSSPSPQPFSKDGEEGDEEIVEGRCCVSQARKGDQLPKKNSVSQFSSASIESLVLPPVSQVSYGTAFNRKQTFDLPHSIEK